jgi:phosphoglycerate kinase
MTNELRTIDDLDVTGRRVLLRADLDVPLTTASVGVPVRVADDTRIAAALTTIQELRCRGARLVLIAHLGRPKGLDPAFSMRPVAERLAKLTDASVQLAPAVAGARVRELTERLEPGQMLMLENVRFDPGETRNLPALALALAELADLYVDDSFVTAHLAHASTLGVPHHLPSAAGRLMEHELCVLSATLQRPARPLVAILGGARLREKVDVVRRFLELADAVCIGGAMCFPFLATRGHGVGYSLCPREDVDSARVALATLSGSSFRLALPSDLLLARWGEAEGAVTRSLSGVDVPDGWMGLDIGARTATSFAGRIAAAGTVFWSGPMGRFELPQFAAGTRTIADAVASTSAATVVAGAETLMALRRFGLDDCVNHLSAGGTAMLEFLAGRELPGVRPLLRNARGSTWHVRTEPGPSSSANGSSLVRDVAPTSRVGTSPTS